MVQRNFRNRSIRKIGLGVLAASFLMTTLAPALEPKKQLPSRVFGTVTNSEGKPAPSITIILTQLGVKEGVGIGGGGGASGNGRGGIKSVVGLPTHRPLAAVTAKTVSDANGVFEFKAVKPGSYEMEAGTPSTVGYISAMIQVKGDGTAIQSDLKLDPPDRG